MPQRVFIDWSLPFLPRVAEQLADSRSDDASGIDLSRTTTLVTGARAGRLLLHLLAERAATARLSFLPPRIITPGGLAEALAIRPPAIASRAEQTLAWAATLRDTSSKDLKPLLEHVPHRTDMLAWLEIASMLLDVDVEVQGARLTYQAVRGVVEQFGGPGEAERWELIARLREAFTRHMDGAGLVEPDAVLWAAAESQTATPIESVALVGITELSQTHVAALQSLEAAGCDVVAFIQAPAARGAAFDEFGCIIAQAWTGEPCEIVDDDIRIVDRPCDQVQAALIAIAAADGRLAAEEFAIGLGDDSLGTSLRRAARQAGLDVHLASGDAVARSRPATLLASIANWVRDRSFNSLATAIRHLDVERLLRSNSTEDGVDARDLFTLLDKAHGEYMYEALDTEALGEGHRAAAMADLESLLTSLAAPLLGPPRPLGDWMTGVIELLHRVYENVEMVSGSERERRLAEACSEIVNVCADAAQIPRALQIPCSGEEAARYVLSQLSEVRRPQPVRAGQIEALGWLELRFDPARMIVITGFNEGLIPSSVSADGFLPDGVRTRLGLRDNAFRYSRDLYVFEAMRHSRERVVVITGRRSATGEPLLPSRFLLAGDVRHLPQRALALSDDGAIRTWERSLGWPAPALASRFVPPRAPAGGLVVQRLRVTQFKRYLECPFRFWLACVRGIEPLGGECDELDPLRFGSLAHEVLRDFGCDESIRESTDADAIESFLQSRLRAQVQDRFGPRPMATVRVQAARLFSRLQSFARLQVSLRRDGWRIHACEFPLPKEAALQFDDQSAMPVSGTIDRIDLHDEYGVMLIDYKTSEAGDDPRTTHGPSRAGAWRDLQLPLYHHLYCRFVNTTIEPDLVALAYITLPRKAEDVALRSPGWNREELESAVHCAREVAAAIRAGQFDPRDVRPDHDPFAIICQTTAFASEGAPLDLEG